MEELSLELSQSHYQRLSENTGVYIFLDAKGDVIYVGKAKNIRKRVSSYFQSKNLGVKTSVLVENISKIKTVTTESEIESLLLEASLIKKYNPKYNAKLTDGKNYILAKITIKDEFPKVLFARSEADKKAIYFGPFPNSSDLKLVLKLIRRIFPYQSVVNHPKKYCLYYHLGLCPCPPMFDNEKQLIEYKRNIHHIVQFFQGKTREILKELEEQRNELSKNEYFEEAKIIQDKIRSIRSITALPHKPFEYEINPNLRSDLRSKEIDELLKILQTNGVSITKLERIECYDISNTGGTHATGSMVVFSFGEKDSSNYRRFKIKKPPKVVPNDFAMMQEVLQRRIRHKQWPLPNLIIVDGGKGQVSSADKVLSEQNIYVPVIGIAKREEILITSDFKQIRLPKNSPALILVRRIRDEAHRFAITYHKKLRSKFIFG